MATAHLACVLIARFTCTMSRPLLSFLLLALATGAPLPRERRPSRLRLSLGIDRWLHDLKLAIRVLQKDRGFALTSGSAADDYKFRTPALRNVALTAPYFHDGAFPTLRDVIVHYDDIPASLAGYEARFGPALPPDFQGTIDTSVTRTAARLDASAASPLLPQTLGLTEREVQDLVAFLESLTDPAALDLPLVTPAAVPSGLPVLD